MLPHEDVELDAGRAKLSDGSTCQNVTAVIDIADNSILYWIGRTSFGSVGTFLSGRRRDAIRIWE